MLIRKLRHLVRYVAETNFEEIALKVFQHQYAYNLFYQTYVDLLGVDPKKVNRVAEIPFLPIQFFKSQIIKTGAWEGEQIFTSSGTTGQTPSKHFVKSLHWYTNNTIIGFEKFYGPVENYCWLALLPAYLERSGSSLVYMADQFIKKSRSPESGFYLNNYDDLIKQLKKCQKNNIPTILLGVTFALLDLAEQYPMSLPDLVIMETGGMKGRRKEIIRREVHHILKTAFQVPAIHSEYGMTELFSQAYARKEGIFQCSPTMRVYAREITDPFSAPITGKTGVINIIDLANVDTIAFIATEDLGKVYRDGRFEVLGRLDNSEIRGCNLMVTS